MTSNLLLVQALLQHTLQISLCYFTQLREKETQFLVAEPSDFEAFVHT